MKLFKIELDNVGYDNYDSCIIVAESKEQVEELCKRNFYDEGNGYCYSLVKYDGDSMFNINPCQKWTIKEININEITEPTIICSSFNAG